MVSFVKISSKDFVKDAPMNGSSSTFKGTWNGKAVAIKYIAVPEESRKTFKSQLASIAKCECSSVVRLLGYNVKDKFAIVMEHMPQRSLYDRIHVEKKNFNIEEMDCATEFGRFVLLLKKDKVGVIVMTGAWELRLQIASDIMQGLAYMHKQGIKHGNLSSKDVLFDNEGNVKLSSFGFHPETKVTRWQAPALLQPGANPSIGTDLYSCAMILWEMAIQKLPFPDVSDEEAIQRIRDKKFEKLPEGTPAYYAKLFTMCLGVGLATEQSVANDSDTTALLFNELVDTLTLNSTLWHTALIKHFKENKPQEAFNLLTKLAEWKGSTVLYFLSRYYLKGEGVNADLKTGYKYLEDAARAGNPLAYFQAGMQYKTHTSDEKKMLVAFKRAAEKHHPQAAAELGYHQFKLGNYQEAFAHLENAVSMMKTFDEAFTDPESEMVKKDWFGYEKLEKNQKLLFYYTIWSSKVKKTLIEESSLKVMLNFAKIEPDRVLAYEIGKYFIEQLQLLNTDTLAAFMLAGDHADAKSLLTQYTEQMAGNFVEKFEKDMGEKLAKSKSSSSSSKKKK